MRFLGAGIGAAGAGASSSGTAIASVIESTSGSVIDSASFGALCLIGMFLAASSASLRDSPTSFPISSRLARSFGAELRTPLESFSSWSLATPRARSISESREDTDIKRGLILWHICIDQK